MGQKIKKIPDKKLVKSKKSISRNLFLAKFYFFQFRKWPKINFWTGKKLKTSKNTISRKKIIYLFDFTSFFAWPADCCLFHPPNDQCLLIMVIQIFYSPFLSLLLCDLLWFWLLLLTCLLGPTSAVWCGCYGRRRNK